jgi:protein-tyrosine phosphatase
MVGSGDIVLPRTQVLPGLFLGDAEDALRFDGARVCVHENPDTVAPKSHWIPLMEPVPGTDEIRANQDMLDAALKIVHRYVKAGMPVLLHCAQGIERSPLVAALYLKRHGHARTLQDAYTAIKALRPIVEDRTYWLPPREKMVPRTSAKP